MLTRTEAIYHGTLARQDEPACITGRNLAHAKRSASERALLAADLHLDRFRLILPTVKQSAVLGRVCVPYVAAAITIADDKAARTAVLVGDCTVLDAAEVNASETLAEHLMRSTAEERIEAARAFGVGKVWDEMIVPLMK